MAYGRREYYPRDDRYNGETSPRSADTFQYHLSEKEWQQQETPPPPSHYRGYALWNAPPPHPGVQESCHVPMILPDAMSFACRYPIQGAGNANGTIPPQWDNWNPTAHVSKCSLDYVRSVPMVQHTFTARRSLLAPKPTEWLARPIQVANFHAAVGTNVQPYAPGIDAPVPSARETIRSLARCIILDPGTCVNVLDVEASGSGGLRVTITLETADIV
ncbi:hypothetical protein EDB83DRAFT_2573754 [Lactarius deliciosus]|nr:hypothetical protein EDB83DRAFT_2573754 [Lactarius deliciosus]